MTLANIARRAFFRTAAGAALGAPVLARAMTEQQPAERLFGVESGPPCISKPSAAQLALQAWERAEEAKRIRRQEMRPRVGLLDYDVATPRSWSAAFRAHVQAEREAERRAEVEANRPIFERLMRDAYGDHG